MPMQRNGNAEPSFPLECPQTMEEQAKRFDEMAKSLRKRAEIGRQKKAYVAARSLEDQAQIYEEQALKLREERLDVMKSRDLRLVSVDGRLV